MKISPKKAAAIKAKLDAIMAAEKAFRQAQEAYARECEGTFICSGCSELFEAPAAKEVKCPNACSGCTQYYCDACAPLAEDEVTCGEPIVIYD